jgi:toluene monooxygenase system protein B
MALFPVISNFQHDFVLLLVPVDTENTMDEVAATAAGHSVGVRVAPRPEKVVRVRRQGADDFFPRDMLLAESGIRPMETLEFIFCDA